MQYIQPELELLLLHIKQVEQHIAGQRERVERLKELGGPIDVAQDVLATMMKMHETLNACVGRITAPVDSDKTSESQITTQPRSAA